MRILSRQIDPKTKEGAVGLRPENQEDLWHIFNLVLLGDHVKSITMRKIQSESASGSVSSSRVKLSLTVDVVGTDFDPASGAVHVSGRNLTPHPHVRIGAYHTLDLEINRNFTLVKQYWDVVALDRLDEATSVDRQADVAAILLNEGLAYVCLITSSMTLVRAKVDLSIPRKRQYSDGHGKALRRFYELVTQQFMRHVNLEVVKCVIIASPGFVKDAFWEYFWEEALRHDWKDVIDKKDAFMLVHTSTGFKHSLREALSDPTIRIRLADTKATAEVRALDRFLETMMKSPDRCVYGPNHVRIAHERLAIDLLLILDSLFRSHDANVRKSYIDLVESVKNNNGTVHVFSSMHVSGEQLEKLTGVAAILRFPIPDIDELIDDDDDGPDT